MAVLAGPGSEWGMALFGGKKDDTERALEEAMLGPRVPARVHVPDEAPTVFEPQPLEDWDLGDSAGIDVPDFGDPDFYASARKETPKKSGSKKSGSKKTGAKKGTAKSGSNKPQYEIRPPKSDMSEAERREALREQMADLARAFKDAPIEEMEGAIKETLTAHGQEVPDAWVTTIAEGLRRNGPTPINYDGVSPRKP